MKKIKCVVGRTVTLSTPGNVEGMIKKTNNCDKANVVQCHDSFLSCEMQVCFAHARDI